MILTACYCSSMDFAQRHKWIDGNIVSGVIITDAPRACFGGGGLNKTKGVGWKSAPVLNPYEYTVQ